MKMIFLFSFSQERFCTDSRFESESFWNSEMAYWFQLLPSTTVVLRESAKQCFCKFSDVNKINDRPSESSEYQRFLIMMQITRYNTHVSYCFRGFWSRFFSIFPSSFCRALLFNWKYKQSSTQLNKIKEIISHLYSQTHISGHLLGNGQLDAYRFTKSKSKVRRRGDNKYCSAHTWWINLNVFFLSACAKVNHLTGKAVL